MQRQPSTSTYERQPFMRASSLIYYVSMALALLAMLAPLSRCAVPEVRLLLREIKMESKSFLPCKLSVMLLVLGTVET